MINHSSSNQMFMPSSWRRIFCSLCIGAAAVAFVAAVSTSRAGGQRVGANPVNIVNKIAPWVVQHTANGQQAEFFVVLADQANLGAAAHLPTKTAKGRFVFETLRDK